MENRGADADIAEPRPFFLSDGVTLVAAAALMLTAGRALRTLWMWGDAMAVYSANDLRVMSWSLALILLSLMLLLYQLARSRDRRRLRRGVPGLYVHPVIATVIGLRLAGWAVQHLGVRPVWWTRRAMTYLRDDFRFDATVAIVASWLALAIVGHWRPERAWDDRLGRAIGALWLIFYLGAPFFILML
jgi:hypothetical protein